MNAKSERNYARYTALGGIINEKDHDSVIARAEKGVVENKTRRTNMDVTAQFSGIERTAVDKAYPYYEILRTDERPAGVEYHHSSMSDQRLFAEALRMVGDTVSLEKLIAAHPHIAFS